ncbi:unnamed protein product [Peronospora belbahrii]|uniref:Uncharacterized protein n=1 Tax=Peronospora belbahrii TaxID=622444 RepID=A0ABN8D890_9STRA|nr:unnamed protein product [Peronospora belbahrii]
MNGTRFCLSLMTEDLRKCIPLSSAAHARVLDAVETLTLALHRHCRKRSLLTFALSYFTGYHSLFRRTVVLNRFTRNLWSGLVGKQMNASKHASIIAMAVAHILPVHAGKLAR